MTKHSEHIVCIKASKVGHTDGKTVDYKLAAGDLMLGQRRALESDLDFRQVLPVAVLLCQGKLWAYRRATNGGEERLHGKVAIAVGGHWDAVDLVWRESNVDLDASIKNTLQRELDEEVSIDATIISSYVLPRMICSTASEVDSLHLAQVTIYELDSERVEANETQLIPIGFMHPRDLLQQDDCETWTRVIAEILLDLTEGRPIG